MFGGPGEGQSALTVTGLDHETADSLFKEAFREGKYPWYDSHADRVRPVWPVRISWLESLGERLDAVLRSIGKFFDNWTSIASTGPSVAGESIGRILLIAALMAFFLCILMSWIRRDRGPLSIRRDGARPGIADGFGELPDGIRSHDSDPWAEANRRRAAGDLAGAVVCLFAHQLISLNHMGLIRLAPGRTGRQYVSSLRNRELIDSVGATLGLFEEVYYGRSLPTAQAFEAVWNQALRFEERRRGAEVKGSP
jgi:hypothetical protein